MAALNYATQYAQALGQAYPYVLYFGRLYSTENNGKYRWPRNEQEAKRLTEQQIRWLTEGLEIEQKRAIKPGKKACLY